MYETVAEIAQVPLNSIRKNKKSEGIENTLKKDVIGQEKAIEQVSRALERADSGMRDASRPLGSFIFCGESGVGKSHLAKSLSSFYSSLIHINMSEFSESHTVSRLIGAPAGYVGYEEAGMLTEKIRRSPAAVTLFDGIEKAHPRVLDILSRILEEGRITDNRGKRGKLFKLNHHINHKRP